ncbi:hypothetical protein KLGR111401_27190 [Klebsiella grimontii]
MFTMPFLIKLYHSMNRQSCRITITIITIYFYLPSIF